MLPTDYVERCYAGWLGKVIGVRHGACIEGWTYETIRRVYGEIRGYLREYHDFAADDDTNGPLFFLRALEDLPEGAPFGHAAAAEAWLNYIPWEHGMLWWGGYGNSTEHTAYLNLQAGIDAPMSGSEALNGPAVAGQIGGQIFSDCWGLIWPGNPEKAAEYAQVMAEVSHGGEAVNGARFVAGAIAAAFTGRDIRQVLETALALLPEGCEYLRMARDVFAFHDAHDPADWRAAMEHIIGQWGYDRYPGNCHVIPNSAVMIMSMLYGDGDFSKTINICNMCGWDTDCNVGNVGTILGVFVSLRGIDERWRKPVNDFLVSSSAVGCLNITTLPAYVRRLASLGYHLAGEPVPERWKRFLSGEHAVDFTLPGSTWAFRLDGDGDRSGDFLANTAESAEEEGLLKVRLGRLQPGEARSVYYGTYYHPADFADSRYDPAFSPVVRPGEEIRMRVRTDGPALRACLFCREDHTGEELFGESVTIDGTQERELAFRIPPMEGGRISRVGLRVLRDTAEYGGVLLCIPWMDLAGRADYAVDFSREKVEQWPGTLHKEVTEMTRVKGLWEVWDGKLHGSCADFGAALTGDVRWKDADVTCAWSPENGLGACGFGVRVQGAARGYWLLAQGGRLAFNRQDRRGLTELASCPLPPGPLCVTVRCRGDRFEIADGDRVLLRVTDGAYGSGMTGLAVRNGARCAFETLRVRER